jgi:squalene-hopene/tetraprenyl-beta-curcumene cyclase
MLRSAAVKPSLRVLRRMQPASGGYLEAVPLTSFVVMSLAATGRVSHRVTRQGVKFIVDSVRPDGSWPIDTNLAAWNTTLALNALAGAGEDVAELDCLDWLLSCQQQEIHPFTGAEPGGFGWSDLSGAVPDADDTPGALLALGAWRESPSCSLEDARRIEKSAEMAVRWLLGLQNRDGGWPTFCRGWGKLPFDRSGADLTAHALRALHIWQEPLTDRIPPAQIEQATRRGLRFLDHVQRDDGSWTPLWFGNQDQPGEENPVYGTAKVLLAYRDLGILATDCAQRGLRWLQQAQDKDGGWGGGAGRSSVEETALAVEALLAGSPLVGQDCNLSYDGESLERGLNWLIEAVETGRYRENSPIGFYFAKLWYHEKLYPLTFTLSALGQALRSYLPSASSSYSHAQPESTTAPTATTPQTAAPRDTAPQDTAPRDTSRRDTARRSTA